VKGLPVSIYRIGPVVGDAVSGISAHHDFVWLLLKSCVQLGAAPRSDWNLHLTPVDFAVNIMSAKILEAFSGKTMHLFNPARVTLDDLIESARRFGFDITPMLPVDWVELVREIGTGVGFSPYATFRKEFIDEFTSGSPHFPELDHAELDRLLQRTEIKPVSMDAARLDFYFGYLLDSGFIEAQSLLLD
jgi:thioester reductase-like protein